MQNKATSILKEQLRIKEKEIQRIKAEARKSEQKKDYIVEISKEKINQEIEAEEKAKAKDKLLAETKLKLEEKEKEKEKFKLKLLKALDFIKTQNSANPGETTATPEKTAGSKNKDNETTKKVKKAVRILNSKNDLLSQELEALKISSSENEARKELLEQEIINLREKAGDKNSGENKDEEQNENHQQKINKYKEIIKAKDKVLKDLQNSISGNSEKDSGSESSPADSEALKNRLKDLISEKEEAEKKLKDLKSNFDKKLRAEKENLIKELEEKIKRLKNQQKQSNEETVEEEEGAPAWMATFADMVTLVLCFFILMYAIASQNVSQFKAEILGTETKSIGVLELLDSMTIRKKLTELTPKQPDSVVSDIKAVTKEAPVDVEVTKDTIILRIPGQALFKTGGADLSLDARASLDAVINVTRRYPDYSINIQGHTDDFPISTARFPSNWELSASRATAVLRYFIDKGFAPERLTATGYADTFPLFSNDTKTGQLRNRRVEIILEKES